MIQGCDLISQKAYSNLRTQTCTCVRCRVVDALSKLTKLVLQPTDNVECRNAPVTTYEDGACLFGHCQSTFHSLSASQPHEHWVGGWVVKCRGN